VSNTAYSDLKAAWHTDKIATLRRGDQIVPAQVQLILSDLCNQDCHFCAYRMSGGFSTEQFADEQGNKNPRRRIQTSKALEILGDCAVLGVKAIQFTGGGEPTVHPDHLDLFKYAQEMGMETSLVTNGIILRPGWESVYPQMSWIRVSVDAGSAEEYARVRRTSAASYDKVLENIEQIAHEIASSGSTCLLGVGYVITRENWQDLYEGVARLKETGAHNVRLSAMFSKEGSAYYDGIHESIRREVARCKELESSAFQVIDLFGDRIADLEQHAPDYDFCGYQQFNCYIGGNLKVYRCCTTAYTLHGEVGDLKDQRFADWFYSQSKKDKYKDFCARSCDVCQFNSKNRTIEYLVGETPLHVNFV
jgi:MoaA/NifB/PqqE/SkfB family radical SAM enzyme